MSDIIARQRQLIGTTAEWAAHNIVLADGEIGLERDTAGIVTAKIGDGTSPWSLLPHAFAGSGGGTGGLTQAQADALYVALTSIASAGGAANSGKVLQLDAGGKIPESAIPDLSNFAVVPADLVAAGGPGVRGKVPVTNDSGVLPNSFIDGVTTGGTAAQAGKVPFLDAAGKVDGAMLPPAAIEDAINTWASTNDVAYMYDTRHISFPVVRTETPSNREIFSLVVPASDVTLPVYGGGAGQMREGDNMRILNVNAAKIKVTGANLIIIGNPAIVASVDIAPAGMAKLYWVNQSIYVEGEGVTASA